MSDANEQVQMRQHEHRGGDHGFVIAMVAGTALGVGVGMLLAPRKGSELREQVAGQAKHMANRASTSYDRAKNTAGHYAHRGHDAYCVCRDKIARGAHHARRYVREVADAVTLKSRQVLEVRQPSPAAQGTTTKGTTMVASPAQAIQRNRGREQASPPHEAAKETNDLRAV